MPDRRPSVYIETSVISYRVARPATDVIVYAHQLLTNQWWERALPHVQPFVSRYVWTEAGRGDAAMAAKRLALLDPPCVLPTTPEAEELARMYLAERLAPINEVNDALHLSLASVHGIDYLLTWNCRHIAAAEIRRRVAIINTREGNRVPILCTPEELMEFSSCGRIRSSMKCAKSAESWRPRRSST